MRRYDDPVDVRRGRVGELEAPAQFVWRDRLWVVCTVVGHWLETGPWWERAPVHSVLGLDTDRPERGAVCSELLAEREIWRVEAGRGPGRSGVFDLAFDWQEGQWRLVHVFD